jgi:parvulin-like peptidyl-prolyl isomerase
VKKLLGLLVAGALLLRSWAARAALLTAVSVAVNDSVITLGEIRSRATPLAVTAAKAHGDDDAAFSVEMQKFSDQVMKQMVEDKLVLHEFVTSGYMTNLLESFIDDQIQESIRTEFYGDRARLIQTLHEQGLTYEEYRRSKRERIIIEAMNRENISAFRKIFISPLKVDQYYQAHKDDYKMKDQIKLRMITLPQTPDTPPGSAKRLAEEVLAKIDSGVPFTEMASVYTSGSQRAEGGDRGWIDRTSLKPSLTDVAFSLKPGQHSGVIEQPEACYLMMVEDVKPAHVKELSEVREEIERTLRNDESLRLRKLWIERLERKSYVRYY